MSFLLIAFLALGTLLGLTSTAHLQVERAHVESAIPPGTLDGAQFARFAGAMEQYAEANPSASGQISPLNASGQFTASFLGNVTAWLSPAGTLPRVLVCAATLGRAALPVALRLTGGDAAFGTPTANGQEWVSSASNGPAQPLPAPVSSTATIVFVIDVQS